MVGSLHTWWTRWLLFWLVLIIGVCFPAPQRDVLLCREGHGDERNGLRAYDGPRQVAGCSLCPSTWTSGQSGRWELRTTKPGIMLTRTQSCLRRLLALLCFEFFSHMTIIPSPCGVLERLRQWCKWVCGYLGNDRCSCAVSCSLCTSFKQGRQDPEQQTQAYRYKEVGAVFPVFVCPST